MREIKIIISVILFSVILLVIYSFQQQKDQPTKKSIKEQKIAPEVLIGVGIKVSEFKERKRIECIEKAQEVAVFRMDSIMTAEAFSIKRDTINKPGRVIKPLRPALKPIPDSIKVKPIIEKN